MHKLLLTLFLLSSATSANEAIKHFDDKPLECSNKDCQNTTSQKQQLNRINENYQKNHLENSENSKERMEYIYEQHERQWKNRQQ